LGEIWMVGNLKGDYLRLMPGLCLEDNKLVGKFKMTVGYMVSIRGQVMEYTYVPTGIKRELVRSGVDSDWNGQVVGTVARGPVAIHSSGQIILSLTHIEGITLGAGEEVDEVAGGASGMSVNGEWYR
jgi:hypothetical protein